MGGLYHAPIRPSIAQGPKLSVKSAHGSDAIARLPHEILTLFPNRDFTFLSHIVTLRAKTTWPRQGEYNGKNGSYR